MNTCPHCGRPAMSFWKKMVLGPGREVSCAQCRNLIGFARGKAYLSLVPWLIFIACIPFMRDVDSKIIAGIAAILVTVARYWWWVPIEKRGLTVDREGALVKPGTGLGLQ